jgi:hypothetical protein
LRRRSVLVVATFAAGHGRRCWLPKLFQRRGAGGTKSSLGLATGG